MCNEVRKALRLDAAPDRVWRALTEPAELGRWFPDETDLEPHAGSTGTFHWRGHGRWAARVDEAVPPKRLVWCWARDRDVELDGAAQTTVEWTLQPRTGGGTLLVLVETGEREQNDTGWDSELRELVKHLEESSVPERWATHTHEAP